jgi:hypothetical protein
MAVNGVISLQERVLLVVGALAKVDLADLVAEVLVGEVPAEAGN